MSIIISEKTQETSSGTAKMVELKHMRTMKAADGSEVEVVDFVDVRDLDSAITETENRKQNLEAELSKVNQQLTDLQAIKDAE
tara:strand:- start:371 stop:619 length:249 start_codon:yes stop_codon:yes gene_type:complete